MTPADFEMLKKGDTIQDMRTGKAYIVANEYDEATHGIDVTVLLPIDAPDARYFKKVSWPN